VEMSQTKQDARSTNSPFPGAATGHHI